MYIVSHTAASALRAKKNWNSRWISAWCTVHNIRRRTEQLSSLCFPTFSKEERHRCSPPTCIRCTIRHHCKQHFCSATDPSSVFPPATSGLRAAALFNATCSTRQARRKRGLAVKLCRSQGKQTILELCLALPPPTALTMLFGECTHLETSRVPQPNFGFVRGLLILVCCPRRPGCRAPHSAATDPTKSKKPFSAFRTKCWRDCGPSRRPRLLRTCAALSARPCCLSPGSPPSSRWPKLADRDGSRQSYLVVRPGLRPFFCRIGGVVAILRMVSAAGNLFLSAPCWPWEPAQKTLGKGVPLTRA